MRVFIYSITEIHGSLNKQKQTFISMISDLLFFLVNEKRQNNSGYPTLA